MRISQSEIDDVFDFLCALADMSLGRFVAITFNWWVIRVNFLEQCIWKIVW